MGEVLNNGVYLPDRGERNAYDGLKGNWNTLDSIAGKVSGYDGHISDTDIHVTAADKQTWNGKADASHVHNANDVTTGVFDAARIPNLDASKITTGTIDIDRLPQGALERLVKVADQAARYALTAADVQLGDTVQQLDTGVMYVVTDETKLDSADGYTEYTAGSATSVPWSGVTGKPADYTPASHSHGNITNDGKVGTTANKPLITGTGGVVQAGSFGNAANTFCEGNDSRLSDARTPLSHTHTKANITDLLNSNFIPSANNSYDLGSSSYQWNNLYAKNYYYNGVAWGLDKANEWTQNQTIRNNSASCILKNPTITKGVIPANNRNITFAAQDTNGGEIGRLLTRVSSNGETITWLAAHNLYKNGALDPTGNDTWANFVCYLSSDGSAHVETNCDVSPDSNTTNANLGTSTNKWKTLNGVNPGVLSIFNPSATPDPIDVPNTWVTDGSAWNTLNVSNMGDGWVIITYNSCVDGDYILARFGGIGGTRYPSMLFKASLLSGTSAYIYAFFPVAKAFGNIYLEMKISSNANLVLHHFIPAYGTV